VSCINFAAPTPGMLSNVHTAPDWDQSGRVNAESRNWLRFCLVHSRDSTGIWNSSPKHYATRVYTVLKQRWTDPGLGVTKYSPLANLSLHAVIKIRCGPGLSRHGCPILDIRRWEVRSGVSWDAMRREEKSQARPLPPVHGCLQSYTFWCSDEDC